MLHGPELYRHYRCYMGPNIIVITGVTWTPTLPSLPVLHGSKRYRYDRCYNVPEHYRYDRCYMSPSINVMRTEIVNCIRYEFNLNDIAWTVIYR